MTSNQTSTATLTTQPVEATGNQWVNNVKITSLTSIIIEQLKQDADGLAPSFQP
jgi:hypothetical protein